MKRRARKFGDNIDTDSITPASTLQMPMAELKKKAFAPIFKDFYKSIKKGDIIVAGKNFGCGSSREQAAAVLKELGIDIIIAESMARIYFRNCIALGIYPVLCKGCGSLFAEGDEIEINLEKGSLENERTGRAITFRPLSDKIKEIVLNGGILAALRMAIEIEDLSDKE